MMELQLTLLTAALVAISSWMIAWHIKIRRDQRLLAPGVVPIQKRKRVQNENIAVFLPRSDYEHGSERRDLLVIEQDGIRSVDRYDLQHLHETSGKSHFPIETFSLTD